MSYFTPKLFTFFRSLKRHNDRQWFADNRQRYVDDVEAPMLQFIIEFAPRLRQISRAYVADPRRSGGSMFRIYRDTRFSSDKSPFKVWTAARFGHERRKQDDNVPGFYLHLGTEERIGGGGVYHLEMPALTRIRRHIVDAPARWTAVKKSGVVIEGDMLARAPAGFDPAHKFIEDLRRKDLYSLKEFTEAQVVAPDFLDRYTDACVGAAPLVEFLTKALELKW